MNATNNESSITIDLEIQLIKNAMLSRYFAAAGLVLLSYDTILTTEEEVSKCLTQVLDFCSLFVDPPRLAGAFQASEATLLH